MIGHPAALATRIFLGVLGTDFWVDTTIPGLAQHLRSLLGPFLSGPTTNSMHVKLRAFDQGRGVELLVDGDMVARRPDIGSAIDALMRELTSIALRRVTQGVPVHAAGVVRGKAILLPAPSGGGKSTLTAALVRGGFDFLSDEAVVIDPDTLLAHPFPRPLGLSPTSMRLLGLEPLPRDGSVPFHHYEHHVPAEELRSGCLAAPAPVGAIVVPRISRAGRTTLRPIARSAALHALARHRITDGVAPRRAFEMLRAVTEASTARELEIDSLERACELLRVLADELP